MAQGSGALIRTAGILVPLLLLLLSGLTFFTRRRCSPGSRQRLRLLQRLSPRPAAPSPVVVVDIDDASLSRIGQWPWPRRRLAELIGRLADAGAQVIALDLLLAEPDRSVGQLPDAELALALTDGRVVTGFALTDDGADAKPALKAAFAIEGGGGAPLSVPDYRGAITTLPEIEAAAAGNGALNVPVSTSGIVRRAPMLLRIGNQGLSGIDRRGAAGGARRRRLHARHHRAGATACRNDICARP